MLSVIASIKPRVFYISDGPVLEEKVRTENYHIRHHELEVEAEGRTQVPALRLSVGRVALLTVMSSGLYLFYWFYLTWKQLQTESSETHYPVWHALTLMVPIYGLFRMHRHVSLINEPGLCT